MKSIKSKILTVVISGLLVITAVVTLIAVNMTHGIMHKDADRILNNATQKEAAYINDLLGDVTKSAAIMQHYAASELSSAEQLKDPEFLEKYLRGMRAFFTEIALNTGGAEGFFLCVDPRYSSEMTGFYNVLSPEGVTEMPFSEQEVYEGNLELYYGIVEAKEAVWLEPYFYPGYDKELISYATPFHVGSELVGVVGLDVDFDYLTDKVEEISVYEKGYASLLSGSGETTHTAVPKGDSSNPHTKATASLLNGMTLVLRADYQDIQSDIHPMLGKIVIAFLIVLLLSIVYTVTVTIRIVKPLKELTSVAEEISEGVSEEQLSRFPVNSKDEVGTLSRVLKSAYGRLVEYTAYINALAYRDSLTGLKNSTAYSEAIAGINSEINCGSPSFGVVVVDINNLKRTNDKYGHDIGNDLIKHSAGIIAETFRTSAVFRIGGDEFVIIVRGKDLENYRALLERLDEACAQDYITVCENRLPVSLARGVAIYDPSIDHVYDDVFAKADHAMYLHKNEKKAAEQ